MIGQDVQYEELVGLAYAHGARVADGQGMVDCYGVVVECYRRRGIALPDPFKGVRKAWGRTETWIDVQQLLGDLGRWQKLDEPRRGCVVLMSRYHQVPDHVGVMLDERMVLHALEVSGVVIQRLDRMTADVVGFYDYH